MRVKYLAQEHNAVPRPGLEPGPPDPESSHRVSQGGTPILLWDTVLVFLACLAADQESSVMQKCSGEGDSFSYPDGHLLSQAYVLPCLSAILIECAKIGKICSFLKGKTFTSGWAVMRELHFRFRCACASSGDEIERLLDEGTITRAQIKKIQLGIDKTA